MPVTEMKIRERLMSEDDITRSFLESFDGRRASDAVDKDNKNDGVKDYPILEFDNDALALLQEGVVNTLKHSDVKPAGSMAYKILKRLFDIVFSLLALLILLIPIVIISLVIYLSDRGNPFFCQVRLTEKGKPFKMFKLRTMCVDAERRFAEVQKENGADGVAFKMDNDPRVTKVGKILRKLSIDELPQFINVLCGHMSVIGPRPPLPREVVLYTPQQMDRLLVKGGLSCICQTEGRSDMEFDKWVEGDIEYIKSRSVALDLKLIFKTVGAVLMRKGAK